MIENHYLHSNVLHIHRYLHLRLNINISIGHIIIQGTIENKCTESELLEFKMYIHYVYYIYKRDDSAIECIYV